jgi:5-methyltetrahydropteroyltriglutamate--homocysteine methyltransferase
MPAISANLGFPRIGSQRELKFALEQYWSQKTSEEQLLVTARKLQQQAWLWQKEAGIQLIPVGDFALYDHVLNTIELVGAIPARYQTPNWTSDLQQYFAMARGTSEHGGLTAMEMTKWYNTNYHYIVPEWTTGQKFALNADNLLKQIKQAREFGFEPRPVIVGPVTLVMSGKAKTPDINLKQIFEDLLPVYVELFALLQQQGVRHIQLDEPCLSLDLSFRELNWLKQSCTALDQAAPGVNISLTSYFDDLGKNMEFAFTLPVQTIHLDLVSAPEQLDRALKLIRPDQSLSLGLVNGRNVWKTDLEAAITLAEKAVAAIGLDRIVIAPSCSLLHSPIDLDQETELDPEVKAWLAFAKQKLTEIATITHVLNHGRAGGEELLVSNRHALAKRRTSQRVVNPQVRQRLTTVTPEMYSRKNAFPKRAEVQQQELKLPLLPTTTIGSFPQTPDIRKARSDYRSGKITEAQYDDFLKQKTIECIRWQEEIGIDVLVHGEFERNDMVEYFGEQLEGFIATANGWVQSYGSRCVKPPIIFGDISRKGPMTVAWSHFAQKHSQRFMKGMLTGPVTILFWSFIRDDQPRSETCRQIALAIRDEVHDLEQAGIRIIQIDEPAIREGLPLKAHQWKDYLQWAVDCFRLSSSSVADATQIHTHMCYSEFNDILPSIAALDADVISIETSRSQMELLDGFKAYEYPNAIGPGVYDIHSPRVPTGEEVQQLIRKAAQVIPADRLWINPDCGLKTRGWTEVKHALSTMVEAAEKLRQELV